MRRKQQRKLTEEQRQRIMDQPGVVVNERTESSHEPFYTPKIHAYTALKITASDLINAENDEEQFT